MLVVFQSVRNLVEQFETVDSIDTTLQIAHVKRLAGLHFGARPQQVVGQRRPVFYSDTRDHRLPRLGRAPRGPIRDPVTVHQRQPAQDIAGRNRRGRAGLHCLDDPIEARAAEIAHVGQQQHILLVQHFDLPFRVAPGQKIAELVGDRQKRIQFLALIERCADIHRDDHVGAHCTRDTDRKIVGNAAVDKQMIADLDRSKNRGDRHAGVDRLSQHATAEHDLLAGHDIRRDGPERNRQQVEIAHT